MAFHAHQHKGTFSMKYILIILSTLITACGPLPLSLNESTAPPKASELQSVATIALDSPLAPNSFKVNASGAYYVTSTGVQLLGVDGEVTPVYAWTSAHNDFRAAISKDSSSVKLPDLNLLSDGSMLLAISSEKTKLFQHISASGRSLSFYSLPNPNEQAYKVEELGGQRVLITLKYLVTRSSYNKDSSAFILNLETGSIITVGQSIFTPQGTYHFHGFSNGRIIGMDASLR
jgi:hypothetical protein